MSSFNRAISLRSTRLTPPRQTILILRQTRGGSRWPPAAPARTPRSGGGSRRDDAGRSGSGTREPLPEKRPRSSGRLPRYRRQQPTVVFPSGRRPRPHAHPNPAGHQENARGLAAMMKAAGLVGLSVRLGAIASEVSDQRHRALRLLKPPLSCPRAGAASRRINSTRKPGGYPVEAIKA